MASNGQQCEELARNLIDTLGPERAVHVANQFGWYGVVEEIDRQKGREAIAAVTPLPNAGSA